MKETEKQITSMQLFCLIIIVGLVSSVLTLPQVLAAEAGRDMWLSALLGFAAFFAVFFAVVRICKLNPGADLYTAAKESLGAVGAKIIYALLALFFAFKTLMLFCETESFCSARLYGSLPWYLYALVFGGVAVFMAVRGLKTIARCGELFIAFIIAALLVCTISAAGQMEPARVLPVAENGFAPVFKGFYKTAAWYGDFLIVLMAVGKIKPGKGLSKALFGAYGAVAFAAAAFVFAYYAMYGGLISFHGRGGAFADIINFSKDSSTGLITSVFNQIWILGCFLKLAVMFWAANEALMKTTGISKPVITAPILSAALYLLNIFVFRDAGRIVYIAAEYAGYFTAGLCLIVPAVLLICAARYKERHGKGGKGVETET